MMFKKPAILPRVLKHLVKLLRYVEFVQILLGNSRLKGSDSILRYRSGNFGLSFTKDLCLMFEAC